MSHRLRASALCVHDGRVLCVQLRDPSTRVARLFVPGGAIEAGETPAQAAARETLEETGYRILVDTQREHVAHYPFVWNAQPIAVTTHFFLAQLADPSCAPQVVHDAPYLEGTVWLALDDVPAQLGFDDNILAAMLKLLAQHRRTHALRSDTDI